jgi:hypothetical protein
MPFVINDLAEQTLLQPLAPPPNEVEDLNFEKDIRKCEQILKSSDQQNNKIDCTFKAFYPQLQLLSYELLQEMNEVPPDNFQGFETKKNSNEIEPDSLMFPGVLMASPKELGQSLKMDQLDYNPPKL